MSDGEPVGIPAEELVRNVAEHWGQESKPGEQVEGELSRFIQHRDRQRRKEEGERREEEEYQRRLRRNEEREQAALARQRYEYHRHMALSLERTMSQLIGEHTRQAERYRCLRAG